MAKLTQWLDQKFYLADGITPNAGGKIFTYKAGTTTKKDTLQSESGSDNTNPIIANAAGEVNMWFEAGAYKVVNAPANDTDPPTAQIKTWDDINASGADGEQGIVNTVAELAGLDEGAFETVQVLGGVALGDNGAGLFRWNATSTTTPVAGMIVAAAGDTDGTGRWFRVYTGALNVGWFFATGDGSTDDTSALNNAGIFASANEGDLYMPDGSYLITSAVTIPSGCKLIMGSQASFTAASAITITINGEFECGLSTAFAGSSVAVFAQQAVEKFLPQWWGAVGDGSTDDYTSINKAVTAATAVSSPILFTAANYKISTNITFPLNIELKVNEDALLSPDTGITLTIEGSINAKAYQIFSGLGVIEFNQAQSSTGKLQVKWWGAVGDDSTDDTANIQKAILASSKTTNTPRKILEFTGGIYRVTQIDFLDCTDVQYNFEGAIIRGTDTSGTQVVRIGDGTVPSAGVTPAVKCVFRNLYIDTVASASASYTYGLAVYAMTDCSFYDSNVITQSSDKTTIGTGVFIDFCWNNTFINTQIKCQHALFIGVNNCNNNNFLGGRFRGNSNTADYGIQMASASNAVRSVDVSNFKYGLLPGATRGCVFDNIYLESIGSANVAFGVLAGNSRALRFSNCYFLGGIIGVECLTTGVPHRDVSFENTHFKDLTTGVVVKVEMEYFTFDNNHFESVTTDFTTRVNDSIRIIESDATIGGMIYQENMTRRYMIPKGVATGTVVVDTIARLTLGKPAMVKVKGVGRNTASDTRFFEFTALIHDDGTLKSSTWIPVTSADATDLPTVLTLANEIKGDLNTTASQIDSGTSIGAVQITSGNLEVTTLVSMNWTFWVESHIWA